MSALAARQFVFNDALALPDKTCEQGTSLSIISQWPGSLP